MKTITLKSVMAVLIALFSLNANAYDVEIDGIYYNLVKKAKTAEVTSGDQSYKGDVKIPSSFTYEGEEYSVITIKSSAFNTIGEDVYAAIFGEDVFRSISIPPSIKKIENGAFVFCDNLTSVYIEDLTSWCNIDFGNGNLSTGESNPLSYAKHLFLNGEEIKELIIPNDIIAIKNNCFKGCLCINSVIIPKSVTSIGDYAFSGCSGLTSVIIPNSVTSIGGSAFSGCSGLTSVVISNSVISIGGEAFSGCSSLTSVTIPNNVTSIGRAAFYGCSGLTSLAIPNSVTSIGDYAFSGCSGLTSVTIPNSVASIGDYAFSGCGGLISVTIPNSVTSIGTAAFSGCSELTDVYCYATNPPSAGTDAFKDAYIEYATLHVLEGVISKYKARDPWNQFGNIVALTEDETAIKSCVVDDVKSTKDIHTIDGKAVDTLQKGVNIIRYTNGSVKKVFVK